MELKKICDGLYFRANEQETDRPVLTLIQGSKYSMAIDAGNSPAHVKDFYQAISAQGLQKPAFTVITHWHWDHTFGMQAVEGTTIASDKTAEILKKVASWGWKDEQMQARLNSGEEIEACDAHIRLEYPDRDQICVGAPSIVFSGMMEFDLGDVHCRLIQTDAPHSDDSIIAYIPELKTVIVGDAHCGDYYYSAGAVDKRKLKSFIDVLDELDFNVYISGHDVPTDKDDIMTYLKEEYAEL